MILQKYSCVGLDGFDGFSQILFTNINPPKKGFRQIRKSDENPLYSFHCFQGLDSCTFSSASFGELAAVAKCPCKHVRLARCFAQNIRCTIYLQLQPVLCPSFHSDLIWIFKNA